MLMLIKTISDDDVRIRDRFFYKGLFYFFMFYLGLSL